MTYDYLIVGGGIVGLTVANELISRNPSLKIVIIEKEGRIGMHASGRNSGVLHSGIYYPSGSLKAKVCADGREGMLEFAKAKKINCEQRGKVILATKDKDIPVIEKLLENAKDNNIQAERVDLKGVLELEPYANPESIGGIFCPSTAVIDSDKVLSSLYSDLRRKGVVFKFGAKFLSKIGKNEIKTSNGNFMYNYLVNCAGSYADQIAKNFNLADKYELIPFKGTYWKLSEESKYKIRSNIYPVPDTSMPFLGVHLTRVINNEVYAGPTAIPALGRENYDLFKGVSPYEGWRIFRQISRMYLSNKSNMRKLAHAELTKYFKANFLQSVQQLSPSLGMDDLIPTRKVGIRPQLVNKYNNELEMDYVLEQEENSIHILNAISPAFTSSFTFAKIIADKIPE